MSRPYCVCVCVQQLDPPQQEQLNAALGCVALQLRGMADVSWLGPVLEPSDQEVGVLSVCSTHLSVPLTRLSHSPICLSPGSSD